MSATTLLQRVIAGADLSRLEGDSDIAALLDEVAAALARPASPPPTPATLSADDARQVQSLLAALRDQAACNQTHIDQLAVDLRHLQAIATAAAALCDAAEEVECENGLGLWAQHGQWEPLHDALEAMTSTAAPDR